MERDLDIKVAQSRGCVRSSDGGLSCVGQGDLVSRLIMGIIRVPYWVIGGINLLTESPDPPSKLCGQVAPW